MRRIVVVLLLGLLGLLLLEACTQLSDEGGFCKKSEECKKGLTCLHNRCVKRKTYVTEPVAEPPWEQPSEPAEEPSEEPVLGEQVGDASGPEPRPELSPSERRTQPEPMPSERTTPLERTVLPEPSQTDRPVTTGLTLYEALDPTSSKALKDGALTTIKDVVVTTPVVRLTGRLSTFFVQEQKPRQGSFKYGGLMVTFDRTKFANLSLSLGAVVELQGKFVLYRSVSWSSTCSVDADCTDPKMKHCTEVFNTRTNQRERHCTATIAMPQLDLSAAPKSLGNAPVPAPEDAKPATLRGGSTAAAYLGVLVQVKNVVVTNANPDAPKDYGEFSVADPADRSHDLRVDDQINTIQYTGSKYCGGCSSNKPDHSYCLPGDTCHCSGKKGLCYAGTPSPDKRTLNDTFSLIIGVMRYANGHFKLLPRLPTDMKP